MLKKKQYLLTLLAGIILFFIVFMISYYYMRATAALPQTSGNETVSKHEESIDVLADTEPQKEEVIQPDTTIHLSVVDENDHTIEDKNIDPFTLLGFTAGDLKDKFQGYELLAFSEQKVALKKVLSDTNKILQYTLGLQDDLVCIIENGDMKHYTRLDITASQFSRNTYSMLLKEQIKISSVQKEELLRNPNYIEQILQSYEEE